MSNQIYYWDANIFIAWLMAEEPYPGFLETINFLIEEAEKYENKSESEKRKKKAITIITSVVTFTEVLQGKISPEKFRDFEIAFHRKSMIAVDVDGDIAKLAGEIRTFYLREGGAPKIETADALHLATAIKHNAIELHTFDGSGKKKGLIHYGPKIIDKYDMPIVNPQLPQLSLRFNTLVDKFKVSYEDKPVEE